MPIISDEELNRRRHDILVGARKCFADHGYEGATVRLLEEATGKSRGAIFHHFGDKESLFLALAKEDTLRQAEVVANNGLVEVMREMLRHPERHDWLATRLCALTRLSVSAGKTSSPSWMRPCVLVCALKQSKAACAATSPWTRLWLIYRRLWTGLSLG